jgi:OOP family OmpA-OmpF porin
LSEPRCATIPGGVTLHRLFLLLAGAAATGLIGFAATMANGPRFVAGIAQRAAEVRDRAGGTGIEIRARTPEGWLTRHLELAGGDTMQPGNRQRIANAIGAVPGIGSVHWASAHSGEPAATDRPAALHCQNDVDAILAARSIRFSEASAAIDPASLKLLDEVAAVLRPCLGGIIAVTGHTDSAGDEAANVALSLARADAVRWALFARGIPSDGMRTAGAGSKTPLPGLDPADPANRRIEFSVLETVPLKPTPVDTPGPG